MWKIFHPVSGAVIRTHNLLGVSLLPYLLDQGSLGLFVRPFQNLIIGQIW